MRRLFTLLILLLAGSLIAQNGYYYHSDFSPIPNLRDQYQYDIEQDYLGNIFFANQGGLMTFDGNEWDLIETPGPVFSMVYHDSLLYVAGTDGLGKVTYDVFGNLTYAKLSDTLIAESSPHDLLSTDSLIYFIGDFYVYSYHPGRSEFKKVQLPQRALNLLSLNGSPIIQTQRGCYSVTGSPIKDKNISRTANWLFSAQAPDGKRELLGNDTNALFIAKSGQMHPLALEDDGYLEESIIQDAKWISTNLIAIATVKGGVVFANPETGKVIQIINYHTGLPDNEVQVLFKDMDGALWVAHPHGYTRIDPQIPFRSFNYYPGLEGIIYTSHVKGSTVYVGTNLGLFYLNEVKSYDEVTYYVKRRADKADREPTFFNTLFSKKTEPAAKNTTKATSEPQKKGFLGFAKKKDATPNPPTPTEKQPIRNTLKYEKQVRKELQSITYLYKKIAGVEGRVSQLVDLDKSRLLAAGLDGIFIVENRQAKSIFSEAVKYVYLSSKRKLLLISTYDGSLVSMINSGAKWEQVPLLQNMDEAVTYIFEDKKGRIWLCTTKNLYWVKTDGRKILDGGQVPITNNFLDPVMGADDDSLGLVFVHARGFFKYANDSLSPAVVYGMAAPKRYLSSKERVLVSDDHSWRILGDNSKSNATFDYLRVFDQIASLDVADDGTLWVVTGENKFFKITSKGASETQYNPLLRQIKSANNRLLPITDNLEVDQEEGFLSFHFHQPEYSGFSKTDYRYRLIGINDSWSEWSPNYRDIEFAFLPTGRYQLEVQTRNIFGTERYLEPLYFQIVPPYWKRAWFYALELLFFGSLLYFSGRLSKTKNMKWPIVNKALAFITIIMVIEFLQTGVQSYFNTSSMPVIDFFVQVCIAFSLLPIESLMKSKFFEDDKDLDDLVSGVSTITKAIKSKTSQSSSQ